MRWRPQGGWPQSVVGQALAALTPLESSGWEVLAWFTASTGWLNDRRPADLLADAPAAIIAAALQKVREVGL